MLMLIVHLYFTRHYYSHFERKRILNACEIAASALQIYSWKGSSFTKAKPFVLPVFGLVPNACDAATLFAKVGFLVVLSIKNTPLKHQLKVRRLCCRKSLPPFRHHQ